MMHALGVPVFWVFAQLLAHSAALSSTPTSQEANGKSDGKTDGSSSSHQGASFDTGLLSVASDFDGWAPSVLDALPTSDVSRLCRALRETSCAGFSAASGSSQEETVSVLLRRHRSGTGAERAEALRALQDVTPPNASVFSIDTLCRVALDDKVCGVRAAAMRGLLASERRGLLAAERGLSVVSDRAQTSCFRAWPTWLAAADLRLNNVTSTSDPAYRLIPDLALPLRGYGGLLSDLQLGGPSRSFAKVGVDPTAFETTVDSFLGAKGRGQFATLARGARQRCGQLAEDVQRSCVCLSEDGARGHGSRQVFILNNGSEICSIRSRARLGQDYMSATFQFRFPVFDGMTLASQPPGTLSFSAEHFDKFSISFEELDTQTSRAGLTEGQLRKREISLSAVDGLQAGSPKQRYALESSETVWDAPVQLGGGCSSRTLLHRTDVAPEEIDEWAGIAGRRSEEELSHAGTEDRGDGGGEQEDSVTVGFRLISESMLRVVFVLGGSSQRWGAESGTPLMKAVDIDLQRWDAASMLVSVDVDQERLDALAASAAPVLEVICAV